MYSLGQKFTYTLQNLQNVHYFYQNKRDHTKCVIFLFSTDLNKIFHIKYIYIYSYILQEKISL